MKNSLAGMAVAASIIWILPACAGSGTTDRDSTATEKTAPAAEGSAPSPRSDTTKVTVGEHGAAVESGKASVKVGQGGASVETKDVQISVGDTGKDTKNK